MDIFVPLYILVILVCIYVIFPRQINNFIIRIIKRKQYVVCHMIRSNTDFIDDYLIVPMPDKITPVGGKGDYNLDEKFADNKRKGRWHFVLHEGDGIPKRFGDTERKAFYGRKLFKTVITFSFPTNNEILFTAKALHNSLNNDVSEYLFTKKKDIYYYILIVIIAVLIVALIYDAYVLNQTNQILTHFANAPPSSQIT